MYPNKKTKRQAVCLNGLQTCFFILTKECVKKKFFYSDKIQIIILNVIEQLKIYIVKQLQK